MDARAQRQLFDSLLLIKANLLRMNENGSWSSTPARAPMSEQGALRV